MANVVLKLYWHPAAGCRTLVYRRLSEGMATSVKRYQNIEAYRLTYSKFGDPAVVVKKQEFTVPSKLGTNQVLVKMLMAPVNPADINTIQGTYAVKPSLPSIPGNEGVGQVEHIGEGVQYLKEGDWVLPRLNAWGTWRTHAVCDAEELLKIPNDLGMVEAATLSVNPCTAYRMLHDYQPLSPGDTVIQNGGNSAVGQAVIQIAQHLDIKTVNVVRSRENIEILKSELIQLGATVVLTEEELRKTTVFKTLPKPKLALNCVGGKSGVELLRNLDFRGTMVTYGGMSREPVSVPTGILIFKDLKLCGYWMTRWNQENKDQPERFAMLDFLCSLIRAGNLRTPNHTLVPFDQYLDALKNAMPLQGFVGKKQILQFENKE